MLDKASDPGELTNLVADSALSGLMDEFDRRIAAHMEATGDDWDLHCEFPPPGFMTLEAAEENLRNNLLPRAITVH